MEELGRRFCVFWVFLVICELQLCQSGRSEAPNAVVPETGGVLLMLQWCLDDVVLMVLCWWGCVDGAMWIVMCWCYCVDDGVLMVCWCCVDGDVLMVLCGWWCVDDVVLMMLCWWCCVDGVVLMVLCWWCCVDGDVLMVLCGWWCVDDVVYWWRCVEGDVLMMNAGGRGRRRRRDGARKTNKPHGNVGKKTFARPKVARTRRFFTLLTWKCALRNNSAHFSTSQLPKVVRHWDTTIIAYTFSRHLHLQKWTDWGALYILTWKRASRYKGMHFFDSSTSKSASNVRCF